MTVELILLLTLVFSVITSTLMPGPDKGFYGAFKQAAPRLGARLEQRLDTGAGFQTDHRLMWRPDNPSRAK